MILIEAGSAGVASFEGALLFAAQLDARGHQVVIDERSLPADAGRALMYEAAPFLADLTDIRPDRVIVIGASAVGQATLKRLRRTAGETQIPVAAIGRFRSRQIAIASTTKIAHAIGRDPQVIDLTELNVAALPVKCVSPLVAAPVAPAAQHRSEPEILVFIPPDWLEEPATLPFLGAMTYQRGFRLRVITPAKGEETIRNSRYSEIPHFGYMDLPPRALAGRADIVVFLGDAVPGERMASLALDMMASGRLVVDCTIGQIFAAAGAPVLAGPPALGSLPAFLQEVALPNRLALGAEAHDSEWIKRTSIARLEQELGLAGGVDPVPVASSTPDLVFLPTNGVGLGHAKRSAIIASASKSSRDCTFLAFPSCIDLIEKLGFSAQPLVAKSTAHGNEYANDLLNYLRLRRLLNHGGRLVFDGGYVFDSIYRTIMEKRLDATWIRRGLWQSGQVRMASLEREMAFNRVIVPDEVFPELRSDYSFGPHIHKVGPVVSVDRLDAAAIDDIRGKLAQRFDCKFQKLIVSMLGAGIAADRTAQLQAISGMISGRPDCLHLVVVWPNGRMPAGLSGWSNTRVVRTHNAAALAQSADVTVSAVGYNSFNEILYNHVPAIFVPQMAPIMDDQESRARAAFERGLAEFALAHELLRLERAIKAFLDNGRGTEIRARMEAETLPDPGNADAARLIEEAPDHG